MSNETLKLLRIALKNLTVAMAGLTFVIDKILGEGDEEKH